MKFPFDWCIYQCTVESFRGLKMSIYWYQPLLNKTFHCAGSVVLESKKDSPWNILSIDVHISAQWEVLGLKIDIFYDIHKSLCNPLCTHFFGWKTWTESWLDFLILLCDVINKYLLLLVTKLMVVHKREKKDSISTAREDQQHHLHRWTTLPLSFLFTRESETATIKLGPFFVHTHVRNKNLWWKWC